MKSKKLLSFLLATAMTISLLPTFTLTASADETPTATTEKNITLGTSALKGGQASNVYFGNYQQSSAGSEQPAGQESIDWINSTTATQNSQGPYYKKDPIKWRVLSNDGSKLFLLSDKNLDVFCYHKNYKDVTWATSTIRSWLNGYGATLNTGGESGINYTSDNFIDSAFSKNEQNAIATTKVINATYDGTNGNPNPSYTTTGGDDTDDKVFLLSIVEAKNTAYGFTDNISLTATRKAVNTAYVYGGGKTGISNMNGIDEAAYWWLRSPGSKPGNAAIVDDYGSVFLGGHFVSYSLNAVRPAFNLNLSSVLFTSAADGKKTDKVGKLLINDDNTKNEYKLTTKDSKREFAVTEKKITAPKGGSATFSYENAETGANEYISAMLLNEDKEVLYYGQIKNVTSSSEADGKATVEIPASVNTGTYTLRVFNEQINGDYKTDFSSDFCDITLNVFAEKNITLGTSALSGYDSTNGYKYVYYGTYSDESVKWRVLDMAYKYNKDDTSKTGMFVLSENALDTTQFGTNIAWNGSMAQTWCTNMYNSSFGANEQKYILETNSDNILNNDCLFFLSLDEANKSKYFPNDNNRAANLNGNAIGWWLRSPGGTSKYAACVVYNGGVDSYGYNVDYNNYAARPAFNLNPASVLFTSAKGVKAIDEGKIKKNENYEPCTDKKYEYKLTMLDTSRSGFRVGEISVTGSKGQQITLSYSGAKTDDNEYVSAMIMNDDDEVLYYGQGEKTVDENDTSKGTVKFTLPNEIENGEYTLYVFNEQINGDEKTDFSSDFQTVTLNVLPKATFTKVPSAIQNLAYDGTAQALVTAGVTSDGTVKYSLSENGIYTTDIPTAKNADTYTVWYYIEGDSNHSDSDKASVEVTIAKTGSQTTTTADKTVTYGEELTLTAKVKKADIKPLSLTPNEDNENKVLFYVGEGVSKTQIGTADVSYTDASETEGTATLTIDTKQKQLKIDDNTITAQYGGSVNLNGSGSNAIIVTLNPKEVGLSWSGYDTRDYNGQPSNVTATATGIESGDGEIGVTVTGGKETNADTHTATATELTGTNAEYYKLPDNVTKDYTISPKSVTAKIGNIDDQTYTGRAITPQITVYDDDSITEIPASEYTVGYESNINAGTATVTLTDNADGNYTVSGNTTFIIKKADSSVTTAPTKAENLVYTGEELTLLTADGTVTGGTIKYSINGENFTYDFADIPKVTDAKDDHKIWYKVVGDKNHNDTAPVCIEIKVAKKPINTAITLTAPVKNTTPQTSIETDEYTATVVWSPEIAEGSTFAKSTEYTATITVTPKANYTTDGITEYVIDGTETVTLNTDGTITAVFPKTAGSSGGGGVTRYTVKFNTNGGNTITNQRVKKNGTATEPTAPTKDGYVFEGWYTDSKFTTEYDFDTKVTKNFTLYAKWTEDKKSDDNKNDNKNDKPVLNEWKNPFIDVKENDWFFDSVRYANKNGLMNGSTTTEFAPNDSLTRAMLVTVLYRAAGEPAVNKSIPFGDIEAGAYYTNAVIWAKQNGIVNGVTENEFAPEENITREQIAAIMFRYAKYMKYDVSVGENTNILSYTDFAEISEYAVEAFQYAVGSGLMKGKTETTLNPRDNATRAEIAAILQRFIEGNK